MLETSARLLRLLSLLQTPRDWSGPQLAERLGVSTRTIRTDVERLRGLGYPVHATPGVAGGYRLGAGARMPPLLLDDEEAVAVAMGLRAAAGSAVEGIEEASLRALVKLEQVLPSRLRHRVTSLHAASTTLIWRGTEPTVTPETLTAIAEAVRGHERLRFRYRSRDGSASNRLVEPHRLVSSERHWYLVARDVDREDWRIFRVDRLSDPQGAGVRFAPREPPAADAAAWVRQSLTALGTRYRAVVALHAPLASVAGRVPPDAGVLEPIDEHTCLLRTAPDSLEWLAALITRLGVDFDVRSPPELIDHLRGVAARICRATGGPA